MTERDGSQNKALSLINGLSATGTTVVDLTASAGPDGVVRQRGFILNHGGIQRHSLTEGTQGWVESPSILG